jgi:hypothetical protein
MPANRAVEVRGSRELIARMREDARWIETQLQDLERAQGRELLHRIQEKANTGFHAPGEPHIPGTGPGPNVVTGAYLESWGIAYEPERTVVFTDAPQANRLEYGFHGEDSLGRLFDQAAYPHVEPAADEVEVETFAKAEAIVDLIVRGVR